MWGPPGGVCSAVGSHAMAARPGHHLTPQPLSSGRNIFDELGDGFVLLTLDVQFGNYSGFPRIAKAIGMPLKVVRDTRAGGQRKICCRAYSDSSGSICGLDVGWRGG